MAIHDKEYEELNRKLRERAERLCKKDVVIAIDNEITVSILGTTYTIVLDTPEEDMPKDSDGCMDHSTKTIRVAKFESDRNSIKDLDVYRKKVLRHEIIHAFLYESGMWNNSGTAEAWGCDETITDWIAIQFPKMQKVFETVGCL